MQPLWTRCTLLTQPPQLNGVLASSARLGMTGEETLRASGPGRTDGSWLRQSRQKQNLGCVPFKEAESLAEVSQ
jgi:hypothetical protein